MSYLSVEWRKTQKFSMLMIGICFSAFCSLIGLGIYFGSAYSMVAESEKVPVLWGQLTFYYSQLFFPILVSIYVAMMLGKEFDRKNIEISQKSDEKASKKSKKAKKKQQTETLSSVWWEKCKSLSKEQKAAAEDFFAHVNIAYDVGRIDVRGDNLYYLSLIHI